MVPLGRALRARARPHFARFARLRAATRGFARLRERFWGAPSRARACSSRALRALFARASRASRASRGFAALRARARFRFARFARLRRPTRARALRALRVLRAFAPLCGRSLYIRDPARGFAGFARFAQDASRGFVRASRAATAWARFARFRAGFVRAPAHARALPAGFAASRGPSRASRAIAPIPVCGGSVALRASRASRGLLPVASHVLRACNWPRFTRFRAPRAGFVRAPARACAPSRGFPRFARGLRAGFARLRAASHGLRAPSCGLRN